MGQLIKAILLTTIVTVAGCATHKIEITSNVKPIAVPIIYSPAPPTVTRPVLPHTTIVATDSDGVVVKKYAASVEALIGYCEQLEDIIKQYNTIHNSYNSLASQVASDWKAKTGTTLQIPTPPNSIVTAKHASVSKIVVPTTTTK